MQFSLSIAYPERPLFLTIRCAVARSVKGSVSCPLHFAKTPPEGRELTEQEQEESGEREDVVGRSNRKGAELKIGKEYSHVVLIS